MPKVFLNGKFISQKDAKVSILDRGFLYGDGVFETMRSYDGNVFRLADHLDRLFVSLKEVKIRVPYSKKELGLLLGKLLRINRLKNAYIKLIVTRGVGPAGLDFYRRGESTVVIYAREIRKIPGRFYRKGIRIGFSRIRRNERSYVSTLKSLNYLENILARNEAKRSGFDEAVLLNSDGYITEAATANLFMVKGGVIFTPPASAGLLSGITRKVVIELAGKYLENKLYEKNITPDTLSGSDEIFLTNSVLEIVPVVRLGKRRVGRGRPGVFYKLLHSFYMKETCI